MFSFRKNNEEMLSTSQWIVQPWAMNPYNHMQLQGKGTAYNPPPIKNQDSEEGSCSMSERNLALFLPTVTSSSSEILLPAQPFSYFFYFEDDINLLKHMME
jgi:hypothetical protein